MYTYNAIITNVIDGDTFDLDVDLGFYVHVNVRVRLLNVDTPEKRGSEEKGLGLLVTKYSEQLLTNRKVLIRSKGTDNPLNTDSFGRWLAEIYLIEGSALISLADQYNTLGINKLNANYSVENVNKLAEYIK